MATTYENTVLNASSFDVLRSEVRFFTQDLAYCCYCGLVKESCETMGCPPYFEHKALGGREKESLLVVHAEVGDPDVTLSLIPLSERKTSTCEIVCKPEEGPTTGMCGSVADTEVYLRGVNKRYRICDLCYAEKALLIFFFISSFMSGAHAGPFDAQPSEYGVFLILLAVAFWIVRSVVLIGSMQLAISKGVDAFCESLQRITTGIEGGMQSFSFCAVKLANVCELSTERVVTELVSLSTDIRASIRAYMVLQERVTDMARWSLLINLGSMLALLFTIGFSSVAAPPVATYKPEGFTKTSTKWIKIISVIGAGAAFGEALFKGPSKARNGIAGFLPFLRDRDLPEFLKTGYKMVKNLFSGKNPFKRTVLDPDENPKYPTSTGRENPFAGIRERYEPRESTTPQVVRGMSSGSESESSEEESGDELNFPELVDALEHNDNHFDSFTWGTTKYWIMKDGYVGHVVPTEKPTKQQAVYMDTVEDPIFNSTCRRFLPEIDEMWQMRKWWVITGEIDCLGPKTPHIPSMCESHFKAYARWVTEGMAEFPAQKVILEDEPNLSVIFLDVGAFWREAVRKRCFYSPKARNNRFWIEFNLTRFMICCGKQTEAEPIETPVSIRAGLGSIDAKSAAITNGMIQTDFIDEQSENAGLFKKRVEPVVDTVNSPEVLLEMQRRAEGDTSGAKPWPYPPHAKEMKLEKEKEKEKEYKPQSLERVKRLWRDGKEKVVHAYDVTTGFNYTECAKLKTKQFVDKTKELSGKAKEKAKEAADDTWDWCKSKATWKNAGLVLVGLACVAAYVFVSRNEDEYDDEAQKKKKFKLKKDAKRPEKTKKDHDHSGNSEKDYGYGDFDDYGTESRQRPRTDVDQVQDEESLLEFVAAEASRAAAEAEQEIDSSLKEAIKPLFRKKKAERIAGRRMKERNGTKFVKKKLYKPETLLGKIRVDIPRATQRLFKMTIVEEKNFISVEHFSNAFLIGNKLVGVWHDLQHLAGDPVPEKPGHFTVKGVFKAFNPAMTFEKAREVVKLDTGDPKNNDIGYLVVSPATSLPRPEFATPSGEDAVLLAFNDLEDDLAPVSVGVINPKGYHTCPSLDGNCGGILVSAHTGQVLGFHNGGGSSDNRATPVTPNLLSLLKQDEVVLRGPLN